MITVPSNSSGLQLVWPDVSGLPLAKAVVEYARAGLYVVPIEMGTKNAGSVLGVGWRRNRHVTRKSSLSGGRSIPTQESVSTLEDLGSLSSMSILMLFPAILHRCRRG